MLEFFQRSTGLNHETLRQALKHEDYYVFEWAVKKISSQHITDLYTELADAINHLIGMSVRKTNYEEVGLGSKLYLFSQYTYLPFEDEVLTYYKEPRDPYHMPSRWQFNSLPPIPKSRRSTKPGRVINFINF
jgi:hypothetical protein